MKLDRVVPGTAKVDRVVPGRNIQGINGHRWPPMALPKEISPDDIGPILTVEEVAFALGITYQGLRNSRWRHRRKGTEYFGPHFLAIPGSRRIFTTIREVERAHRSLVGFCGGPFDPYESKGSWLRRWNHFTRALPR